MRPHARFVLLLAALAGATTAHAYPMSGCTTGMPAKIVLMDGSAIKWPGAPDSVVLAAGFFYVLDAQGNPLRNVTVELDLPDDAVSGVFGSGDSTRGFTPSATPLHASVTTTDECWGFLPVLKNGPVTGQYLVSARAAQLPSVTAAMSVEVLAPPAFYMYAELEGEGIVAPGATVTPTAAVRWPPQRTEYYAGVPVSFSIVAGEGARFANGSTTTVAISDAFGMARAPVTVGATPGKVEIRASLGPDEFTLLAAVAGGSTAQVATVYAARDGQAVRTSTFAYGESGYVDFSVAFPWLPAGVRSLPADTAGTFRVWIDGSDAGVTARDISISEVGLGEHEVVTQFSGNAKVAASPKSDPVRFTVMPHIQETLADGATLKLAVADPLFTNWKSCTAASRTGAFGAPSWPAQPPPGSQVSALFSVEVSGCTWRDPCRGFCQPIPVPAIARRVLVARDPQLPAGTVAWAYGPTRADPLPHWYELPTSFSNGQAYFLIEDTGAGDDSLTADSRIFATIALVKPSPGRYQDLWWAGAEENGWGLSITQHRDLLFGELFIYDEQGTARWLAMPSGQWNAARTAYTGPLYRPRGTPYTKTYDASQFVIGDAVGTITLTPSPDDAMRLDYTIDGIRGGKWITRLPFGPKNASPQFPVDDLWWGGVAQNGWGFVVAQQYRTLFALWYTYDENGEATWFVAPSVAQREEPHVTYSPFHFIADLYRPNGSAWIGANYDATRHSLQKVGTIYPYLGPTGGYMDAKIDEVWRSMPLNRLPF